MINFIKGCTIGNSDVLKEEYSKDDKWLVANVNAENIMSLMLDFIELQKDTDNLFLFLEVPCKVTDEEAIKKATKDEYGIVDKLHNEVYYLDGHSKDFIKEMLLVFGEILVNDGFTVFGVGNHDTKDEFGKYSYNEMKLLFNDNLSKYEAMFNKRKIEKNDKRVSPWDLINSENRGYTMRYVDDKKRDIYDVVETLLEIPGFNKYEVVEE